MKPENKDKTRAGLGTPTTSKSHGFLRLPGELRNKVYRHYFREGFRVELAGEHAEFNVTASQPSRNNHKKHLAEGPRTLRLSRVLGKYTRVEGMQTKWNSSISSIALVSKQLYAETITFLYLSTTFASNAPTRILKLLSVVPRESLLNITKLHLHYSTYGDPTRADHRVWQTKHTRSWNMACKAVSKNLTGLKELEIWLCFNGGHVWMDMRNNYLEPLWHFRRLARTTRTTNGKTGSIPNSPKPLQLVRVHFTSHWSKPHAFHYQNWPVTEASEDLHWEFGHAISRAILGWSEKDAMVDVKAAWKRHELWQHHLNFMETGW